MRNDDDYQNARGDRSDLDEAEETVAGGGKVTCDGEVIGAVEEDENGDVEVIVVEDGKAYLAGAEDEREEGVSHLSADCESGLGEEASHLVDDESEVFELRGDGCGCAYECVDHSGCAKRFRSQNVSFGMR